MPSTVYEAVAREYVNAVPIVQDYRTFQSKVFYGGMVVLGAGLAYFYLSGKIPDGTEEPVAQDL
jgi:hypothetical protein